MSIGTQDAGGLRSVLNVVEETELMMKNLFGGQGAEATAWIEVKLLETDSP